MRKISKEKQLLQVHGDLINSLSEHAVNMNKTHVEKFSGLQQAAGRIESARYLQKELALAAQHQESLLSQRRTINLTMEALSYRSSQELAAANEQRSFEQHQLLATRTELLQAEVEKVIDTFFDEAYQCPRPPYGVYQCWSKCPSRCVPCTHSL
jgi:hypothetical protein